MKTLLNQVFSQENVSKSEVTIFLILHEKVEYQNIVGEKTFYISHLMYGITSLEIEALQECFDITFLVHGFLAPPLCSKTSRFKMHDQWKQMSPM